jgi:hypothetical protein
MATSFSVAGSLSMAGAQERGIVAANELLS